jgi:hypothetical protein
LALVVVILEFSVVVGGGGGIILGYMLSGVCFKPLGAFEFGVVVGLLGVWVGYTGVID